MTDKELADKVVALDVGKRDKGFSDRFYIENEPGALFADEFVRDDIIMEISVREDRAFIRDDGTQHQPKGMRHWAANVTATAGETSDNIETDFKVLLNNLEDADVRLLRPAWFMHPSRRNHLRNLRDSNGNLIFPEIRSTSPTLYGYPVWVTTSIPKNLGSGSDESEVYFADMMDMIIGEVEGSGCGSSGGQPPVGTPTPDANIGNVGQPVAPPGGTTTRGRKRK